MAMGMVAAVAVPVMTLPTVSLRVVPSWPVMLTLPVAQSCMRHGRPALPLPSAMVGAFWMRLMWTCLVVSVAVAMAGLLMGPCVGTGLAVRGAAVSVCLLCLLPFLSLAWFAISRASLVMVAADILSCGDSAMCARTRGGMLCRMCLLTRVGSVLPGTLSVTRIMTLAVTGLRVAAADMFGFAGWAH